jgi:phospholipid-binding lipoprotein MlaA
MSRFFVFPEVLAVMSGKYYKSVFAIVAANLSLAFASAPVLADNDPWEPVNARIYTFNSYLDSWLLRPVAVGYTRVLPQPVQTGIENFFYNMNDVNVMANNLLQLKVRDAVSDSGRLLLNSTVGIVGFIDVASTVGLQRNKEDFGQTLGRWGVGPGPYVVLPFFGASTVRDSFGLSADWFVNPIRHINDDAARNGLFVLAQIDLRASLLEFEGMISGDEYLFVREGYLQQREYLILDGEIAYDDYDDF